MERRDIAGAHMVLNQNVRHYLCAYVGKVDIPEGESGSADGFCLEGFNSHIAGEFANCRMVIA